MNISQKQSFITCIADYGDWLDDFTTATRASGFKSLSLDGKVSTANMNFAVLLCVEIAPCIFDETYPTTD